MPRIYYNAKTTVEDCLSLSTISLKRIGFFNGSTSGTTSWVLSFGNQSRIICLINLESLEPYIELRYSVKQDTGESKNISQLFLLSHSECNFGGKRNWFICSCGTRTAFLYKPYYSETFACRICFGLTYESRNLSGNLRAIGKPLKIHELDTLWETIKRTVYRGKPTRKYIKYLKKAEQFRVYQNTWFANFERRFLGKK